VREALEPGTPGQVALMFIDLDDFQGVNDTLGRAFGDQLLRAVAARLTETVRNEDVVPRLGGDEFAVLVRRPSSVERGAVELAERTLKSFALPVVAGEELIHVSLSIGIATGRHSRTRAEELLRDADVAMYKRQGGWQAALRGLHAGDARLDRPPPRPQGRARACDRAARARRGLARSPRPSCAGLSGRPAPR
jgi:diguanylate cyclase (GGDEF)-like protein